MPGKIEMKISTTFIEVVGRKVFVVTERKYASPKIFHPEMITAFQDGI